VRIIYLKISPECPTRKKVSVATAETIGEVNDEKRIEIRIRINASNVLKISEIMIGKKVNFPPYSAITIKSAIVASIVTLTVVMVKPRHLPRIISVLVTGFGRSR
jgi:retron-type reverse transcriptase